MYTPARTIPYKDNETTWSTTSLQLAAFAAVTGARLVNIEAGDESWRNTFIFEKRTSDDSAESYHARYNRHEPISARMFYECTMMLKQVQNHFRGPNGDINKPLTALRKLQEKFESGEAQETIELVSRLDGKQRATLRRLIEVHFLNPQGGER